MMDNLSEWKKEENKDFICYKNKEGYEVAITDHYRWGNINEPTGKYEVIVHKNGTIIKKFISTRNIELKFKLNHLLNKITKLVNEYKKGL